MNKKNYSLVGVEGQGRFCGKLFLPPHTIVQKHMSGAAKDQNWIELFFEIIEKVYAGSRFTYKNQSYQLKPTLVRPADFYRRVGTPDSSFTSLLKNLDVTFKTVARSEVYRAGTGWIDQGIKGFNGKKIFRISVGKESFLIPDFASGRSVGIDTSGLGDDETVIAISCIPDYLGAYSFLELHKQLPKDHVKNELHWVKLNQSYRDALLSEFELVLSICCDGLLVIKTNALIDRKDPAETLFNNLMEGCFSGYETDPSQGQLRPAIRQKFFGMVNGTAIHCDNDFRPLVPIKIAKSVVTTLARRNGFLELCTPLCAALGSHESKPIQISDIIVGMIRTKLSNNESVAPLKPLYFDARKMKKYRGNLPKVYYWFPN